MGELRGELQDTYALLVRDKGGELIHTFLAPPDANLYTRTGRFRIGTDGMLLGEVLESASGNHASQFEVEKLDIQQLSLWAFAQYESRVEVQGSTIKYSRELVRKNVVISAE